MLAPAGRQNIFPGQKAEPFTAIANAASKDSGPLEEKLPEEELKRLTQGTQRKNENVINLLFLGIDRTEERDKTIGVFRPDTIVWASIDMDAKKVEAVSFPRDSYVYIPVIRKKDKLNHSYVWGGSGEKGVQSTIKTLNGLVKYATVDYYFAIDMEPVPQIVDRLGGVELDVEIDMKTHGADLTKGWQLLDGKKVFDYIHWRYAGMGDIDRIKRQQKFAKAMFTKIKETNYMVSSVDIILNYRKDIQTDLTVQQMIALARLMMEVPEGNINFYDLKGKEKMIDNIWYWELDETAADEVFKKVFHVNGRK